MRDRHREINIFVPELYNLISINRQDSHLRIVNSVIYLDLTSEVLFTTSTSYITVIAKTRMYSNEIAEKIKR